MGRSDVERAYADLGWGEVCPAGVEASSTSVAAAPCVVPPRPGSSPAAEATQVLTGLPVSSAGDVEDLDSKLESVFEEEAPAASSAPPADAGQTVLMSHVAGPPSGVERPVPAHAGAAPTEIQLEPQDAIPEPPKEEEDEVDELFMELLDD